VVAVVEANEQIFERNDFSNGMQRTQSPELARMRALGPQSRNGNRHKRNPILRKRPKGSYREAKKPENDAK